MNQSLISRRHLLRYAVSLPAICVSISACSRGKIDHPESLPTIDATVLDQPHGQKVLETLIEKLFPLQHLAETPYKEIADQLYSQTEQDEDWRALVLEAQQSLDSSMGENWLEADDVAQIAAMRSQEQEVWFVTIKFRAQSLFFERGDVWEVLGYQGPSVHHGGYINRGFNDIDWLPEIDQ